MTVEEHLKALFPTAKRTTLKGMVQTGRVRLNDVNGPALRRLNDVVNTPDQVHVLAQAPEPARHRTGGLAIIYEDDDLLVVFKPPGMLTATVPHEPRPTLHAKITEYLARTAPRSKIGMIHRLDKDARGLLVFSKHHDSFFALKNQLEARRISRQYHAVVIGQPNPKRDTVTSRLLEREDGTVFSTTGPKGEDAITHYETLETSGGGNPATTRALLGVTLETGRKHQIRVHLSERGHPIVGDVLYGFGIRVPPLMLAATRLAFGHPRDGRKMEFVEQIPTDLLKALRG